MDYLLKLKISKTKVNITLQYSEWIFEGQLDLGKIETTWKFFICASARSV